MSETDPNEEKETLKRQVLTELEKRALVKEIVKELQPTNWKTHLVQLAKHPAVLLLIGFSLTGIIGARLTSSWQSREWDRQQSRLVTLKTIEQKYAFMDEILKAEAKDTSEIVGMWLHIMDGERCDPGVLKKDKENLIQVTMNWNLAALSLKQKSAVYFRNSDVQSSFEKMIASRIAIHETLEKLLDTFGVDGKQRDEDLFYGRQGMFIKTNEENSNAMKALIDKMTSEIRQDAEGRH